MNFDEVRPVLEAIAMASAANEPLDIDAAGLALVDDEHDSPHEPRE